MKKKISALAVLCLIFSQTLSFGAVTMTDLRLPKDFYPAQSPYAKIISVQENGQFPGFLTFSVTSPHGNYLIRGLTNLRKCLREIDVIEQLNANEDAGSGIAGGAVDSLKDTGTGLKNLAVPDAFKAEIIAIAEKNIKKVLLIEYPELGMEAVYAIDVVDFPAFILVDDKGNDFYRQIP